MLAYNHQEIAPRELKPAMLELEGISGETIAAHYRLYQGYVGKRNEILADFATDRGAYVDAFFDNLDYAVVDGRVEADGIRA